jgi:putative MFS transporter
MKNGIAPFDEVLARVGFGRFQIWLVLACGLGYTADTIELLMLTFVLPELRQDFGLDSLSLSIAPAVSSIGIVIGAVVWGGISDKYGRRWAFLGKK